MQVQPIRLAAQDRVTSNCSTQQVSILQFLGTSEAGIDVNTFCRELQTAATSVLTDPLPAGPGTAEQIRCVDRTLRMAGKLFSQSFAARERLLDRIALGVYSPTAKRAMRDASTAEIARTATALQGEIDAVCPPSLFADLFRQSSAAVMSSLATRADCLAGQTYAQGGLLCPLAVCGNRMIEHNEECDDGNTTDGDGCSADCASE
jgi:cysteine-rich repeat protein